MTSEDLPPQGQPQGQPQGPSGPPPAHPPYQSAIQPPANPYVVPQGPPPPPPYPYPGPHAQPAQHRSPGWSWRASVAGAVAGGVIAASVAVPITWALNRGSDAQSTGQSGGGQAAPTAPQVPGGSSGEGLPNGGDQNDGGGQLGGPFGGSTSTQQGDQTDASAGQSKGVVLIDTQTTSGEAAGTGLVLDSSGLVLTNYHVVEGSTQVKVTVATTGDTYDATVVGHDQRSDIALLQLQGASGLDTVALDEDGDPSVSDAVTAVGNADGQGFLSASTGKVVALDQSIDTQSEGPVEGEHLTGLIQTDAYVVGGYSGGALLDQQGEVVGITTAASSGGATESYAIPIERAVGIADDIEGGHESPEVRIGPAAYLGIAVAEGNGGVEVGQVQKDSPAGNAGVEAGATITQIGDTRITSLDVLHQTLAAYEPGDSVVLRWTGADGQSHHATVKLAESPVN